MTNDSELVKGTKSLRTLRKLCLFIVFAIAITAIAFVGWRKMAQARVEKATALPVNTGISSLEKVSLGGTDQWILIRGHDPDAELLLFLHGGPGVANMPLCHLDAALEKHFIVVQWDQRGAGKSFAGEIADETLTIDQFVDDTVKLTELLRKRFDRDKVYLLGHSWGSVIGAKTAARHPQLFHAYIGVSQVTDVMAAQQLVYQRTLQKAKSRGESEAIAELKLIGAPPFARQKDHITACRWLAHFDERPRLLKAGLAIEALSSPYYSLSDYLRLWRGAKYSIDQLWGPLSGVNLMTEIPSFDIPVVFIQGRDDGLIPGELIELYFDELVAPAGKQLIWIDEAGHLPHLEQPAAFTDAVIEALGR